MTFFSFLSLLVITTLILALTLPVTQLLQSPIIDTAGATLKSLIYCKCNTVDTFRKKCNSNIEIAGKVGTEKWKPRTSKLQTNCNNAPSETIFDYFKKLMMIPFLDYLTVAVESRFDHASTSVYSDLVIIL